MFNDDSTPIKDNWRRLAHPTAQFVQGEVKANIFDWSTGIFKLSFVPRDETACSFDGPDALIVWPWTWWAYINITSQPKIIVEPNDAAEVVEAKIGLTSVVKYAVSVKKSNNRTKPAAVNITLAFVNFQNIDLLPVVEEASVIGPWWAGLAWPGSIVLFLIIACRCCIPCQRSRPPKSDEFGAPQSNADKGCECSAVQCASNEDKDEDMLGSERVALIGHKGNDGL